MVGCDIFTSKNVIRGAISQPRSDDFYQSRTRIQELRKFRKSSMGAPDVEGRSTSRWVAHNVSQRPRPRRSMFSAPPPYVQKLHVVKSRCLPG